MTGRERALALMKRVGMPVVFQRTMPKYSWDGQKLTVQARRKFVNEAYLFHELAHYLCASPYRRKRPEYGLGTSPEITEERGTRLLTHENSSSEEQRASVLGIALQFHHGTGDQWFATMDDHHWLQEFDIDEPSGFVIGQALVQALKLEKRGLMKNGRPVIR